MTHPTEETGVHGHPPTAVHLEGPGDMTERVAFALAGLGGSNAHGSGFLAAAQALARERGFTTGLLPGLEMISCTSGAIASTVSYLRGEDLRADLKRRIDAAARARALWPGSTKETPQQAAAATLLVGVPGVFRGMGYALPQHLWREGAKLVQAGVGWRRAPTLDEVADYLLPAQLFIPVLPDRFFDEAAATLNSSPIGVAFNSYAPTEGVENLYVNDRGLDLIGQYHDPAAEYGPGKRVTYRRITAEGLREALWLFYYGFRAGTAGIDGAYARSIIIDELTFADQVWAVRPNNGKWVGPLPTNLPGVLDLQTELWMNTSYREQLRALDLIGRLSDQGRRELGARDPKKRDFHPIDLKEVELKGQRGFYTYFIEDVTVFDQALEGAYSELSESYLATLPADLDAEPLSS